jgi:hypothetical protein
MKWDDVKDQFFQAADRLNANVDYITRVGQAFEDLVKILYEREPNSCIDQINKDAEVIGQIFTVEDPEKVPVDAINASSQALTNTQKFLFTFLRVAALFQAHTASGAGPSDFTMPPDAKVH